jgi:four helix bundle protein
LKVHKYNDLIAWQKAMDFVVEIYKISGAFPREETYGLTSQIRRAVISVPSNIAEGQSRAGSRDFIRHLKIAQGSLSEVETQLIIAGRLTYIGESQLAILLKSANEVGRLVRGLTQAVERRTSAELETSH